MLRPPLSNGLIMVFRLTLSGLKFQINLNNILTPLEKLDGIVGTDAL